jgi:hypothetical protein
MGRLELPPPPVSSVGILTAGGFAVAASTGLAVFADGKTGPSAGWPDGLFLAAFTVGLLGLVRLTVRALDPTRPVGGLGDSGHRGQGAICLVRVSPNHNRLPTASHAVGTAGPKEPDPAA